MTLEIETLRTREEIVEDLINKILSLVDERYGLQSENPLPYHNRAHTESVLNAVTAIVNELIKDGRVPAYKLVLAQIAAAGHDLVQGKTAGVNEQESGEELADLMRAAGIFTQEEIQEVQEFVDGTSIKIENGQLKQMAGQNLLTQALADADLSSLGMPTEFFWERAMAYAREHYGKSELNQSELQGYIKAEIKLLENHRFYTDVAEKLFPHKQANIEWLKSQLERIG
jgi:predicted metal-dependent HD superfamily phosphohydrolase